VCAYAGAFRNAYNILVGTPEGKTPLGRLRHRWGDKIRNDLREMGRKVWTGCIWLGIRTSGGAL
jgi:hypothetical protein